MRVILENTETHELRELQDSGNFKRPWRIKEVVPESDSQAGKLAVIATQLGLPVPQLLDAARWLLKKDCPYCQLGTQILRRINDLGQDKAITLVNRILTAKAQNDINTLNQIRNEING